MVVCVCFGGFSRLFLASVRIGTLARQGEWQRGGGIEGTRVMGSYIWWIWVPDVQLGEGERESRAELRRYRAREG